MSKNRGLGKGISALIPDMDEDMLDSFKGMIQADIHEIQTNPFQPRKNFSESEMKDLSSSIKEKGILQPLLVKKENKGYQLIAGERRLRAALMAGLLTVPVRVVEADDKEMHEMALIENIQREDLNVIEEASAYQSLIERFNYTQENVSQKVGKSRSAVTNAIRILKLSKNIKEDLINNRISMGHARAYLGLESSSMQEKAHGIVIKRSLSVRNTEDLINKIKKGNNHKISKTEQAQNEFIIDELRKKFSTKVNIIRKGDRGKIVIEYYSGEEFEKIYELLRG